MNNRYDGEKIGKLLHVGNQFDTCVTHQPKYGGVPNFLTFIAALLLIADTIFHIDVVTEKRSNSLGRRFVKIK